MSNSYFEGQTSYNHVIYESGDGSNNENATSLLNNMTVINHYSNDGDFYYGYDLRGQILIQDILISEF